MLGKGFGLGGPRLKGPAGRLPNYPQSDQPVSIRHSLGWTFSLPSMIRVSVRGIHPLRPVVLGLWHLE
jgi:hypothetical protein